MHSGGLRSALFFCGSVLSQTHPGRTQFATLDARSNWELSMQKIDYAKLLGFAAVSDELSEGVDFQNDTVSATLGAKVGTEAMAIVFTPDDDTN
jgi:hypothetical protein